MTNITFNHLFDLKPSHPIPISFFHSEHTIEQFSCSLRGNLRLPVLRNSLFPTFTNFLFRRFSLNFIVKGDVREQQNETENPTGGEEDSICHPESASSDVEMTMTASTSAHLEPSSNLPQSSVSVSSYPGSHSSSSTAISVPSAILSVPPASIANHAPSPTVSFLRSSSTASHPESASESVLQSVTTIASSSASHIRSQSFCFSQPSNVSIDSNASPCNASSSTASNSNASNASSTAATFGTSISNRHGRIMEINGKKFFVINSKK